MNAFRRQNWYHWKYCANAISLSYLEVFQLNPYQTPHARNGGSCAIRENDRREDITSFHRVKFAVLLGRCMYSRQNRAQENEFLCFIVRPRVLGNMIRGDEGHQGVIRDKSVEGSNATHVSLIRVLWDSINLGKAHKYQAVHSTVEWISKWLLIYLHTD